MSLDPHALQAGLAVDLLSGPRADRARGAAAARERRLAGLFLHGLETRRVVDADLPTGTREALRRAARAEEIQDTAAAGEIGAILTALANCDVRPVVLKGRLLAQQVWPRPWQRPTGDLDLLIEETAFPHAVAALVGGGYRKAPGFPQSETSGITLHCPPGMTLAVDLHWRPFRSVGRGIDPVRLLQRAQTGTLDGHPVRTLDEADRLLYLLVHAAKHGCRRLKWLLDLYAVALRADTGTWREATRRASAARATRPFHAAAALLADLPGDPLGAARLRVLQPWWPVRHLLSRLVSLEGAVGENPPSRTEGYAFELLLEESMRARLRRGLRMARRIVLDISGQQA